nr:MAG TPA: hypothetical protein [Bacteriophage sp.]
MDRGGRRRGRRLKKAYQPTHKEDSGLFVSSLHQNRGYRTDS